MMWTNAASPDGRRSKGTEPPRATAGDLRCGMASLDPSPEQFRRLLADPDDGPVVMINLLRYLERASDGSGRTGREAYGDYGAAVLPMVFARGGSVELSGEAAPSLIAPTDEDWDDVVLIRYPSRAAFVDMITSEEYRTVLHHRTAALADSRLIPLRRTDD